MLKQKPKPDPKVRFQNRNFKEQLQSARNYKRTSHKLPEKKWDCFYCKIGLGSWRTKTLAILAILIFGYIVYVPNFLYVKQINITGLKTNDQPALKAVVNTYFSEHRLWPQNNLLLLSSSKLAVFLLAKQQNLYKIKAVKKQWPSTLSLELQPRTEKYLAEIQERRFVISNDGKILQEIPSSSPATNLTNVKFLQAEAPQIGQDFISSSLLDFMDKLGRQIPAITNAALLRLEMDSPQSFDITALTPTGTKLIFDVKSNLDDALDRLRLLFANISENDKQKLYYIDMRFEKKGYVCFKNTPCTKDINIINATTSTSTNATSTTN